MKYENIVKGTFLERPNRFTAYVRLNSRIESVHVKNTGRCKELLREGAKVYLERSRNPERKTQFDLITVEKDGRLINMDSNAPNQAVGEWLLEGGLYSGITKVKAEAKYGQSRLDFYVEAGERKILIEVKGVTLEQDNIAAFPDAPSERAVKHLKELARAREEGYEAYVIFVIQMQGIEGILPNRKTHPAFAETLAAAARAGVKVLAYDCIVEEDSMRLNHPVPVWYGLDFIAPELLKWYDATRRVLPWREEPTPYRVWVSEIMLQQTRVEAVKPYFERFMKALPDISSLAKAEEETLLKLWEGLGYYNRVRNLNKAAIIIEEKFHGRMPDTYEELTSLPGIGSYTAGAIASIAYGRKLPAVDGNVLRVVSRLLADDSDILDSKVKKRVEQDLCHCMPQERAGDFNQAMMELGAMVCLPNGQPKCDVCPLYRQCFARYQGNVLDYPKKAAKKARKIEKKTVFVIQDGNQAALLKRSATGLLAGMYEFPQTEGHLTKKEAIAWLKERGVSIVRIRKLPDSKHIFTHKEWHMIGYEVRVDELERMELSGQGRQFIFASLSHMEASYPIPSAFGAYLNYMRLHL